MKQSFEDEDSAPKTTIDDDIQMSLEEDDLSEGFFAEDGGGNIESIDIDDEDDDEEESDDDLDNLLDDESDFFDNEIDEDAEDNAEDEFEQNLEQEDVPNGISEE